ncbi:hypothetical protein AKJ16_DCAP15801 [Drosera capensis]
MGRINLSRALLWARLQIRWSVTSSYLGCRFSTVTVFCRDQLSKVRRPNPEKRKNNTAEG